MGDDTLKDNRYKKLYVSIIFQALMDLTKLNTSITDTSISIARSSAYSWFFTTIGVTAKDFEEICDNAGLEPTFIRNFAYEVMDSVEDKDVKKRITQFFIE